MDRPSDAEVEERRQRALRRAADARRRAVREHDAALADDAAATGAGSAGGREAYERAARAHRAAEERHLDAANCHDRAALLQAEHARHLVEGF